MALFSHPKHVNAGAHSSLSQESADAGISVSETLLSALPQPDPLLVWVERHPQAARNGKEGPPFQCICHCFTRGMPSQIPCVPSQTSPLSHESRHATENPELPHVGWRAGAGPARLLNLKLSHWLKGFGDYRVNYQRL